jgi:hypothetical protein
MKRNIIVSIVSGFFGSALLLILLSVVGIVGARGAEVNRSDAARSNPAALAALAAPAGTRARFTYQGRLTNSSGTPLNSAVNMVFKLYDSSSGLLWTSATRSVTPVNGLFTVYLGDGSDPNLDVLDSVVSIGVKVGSDPEMTPRQPLNSVVGHSDTSIGVVGSSNSGYGVFGASNTSAGVLGATGDPAGVGVFALGAGPSGTALLIANGNIRVAGAGIGGSTPVFIQQVITGPGGNICATRNYATVVDNPVINGNPNAILIVTPNYGTLSGGVSALGPYGVFYDNVNSCGFGSDKWVIYFISGNPALNNGALINVMAVLP